MQPEDYMSFLVRLWRDQLGADQLCDWHGEIEQIQTGTRWCFGTHSELLAFLQQLAATPRACIQPALEAPIDD
jgi:hypothetical protein